MLHTIVMICVVYGRRAAARGYMYEHQCACVCV